MGQRPAVASGSDDEAFLSRQRLTRSPLKRHPRSAFSQPPTDRARAGGGMREGWGRLGGHAGGWAARGGPMMWRGGFSLGERVVTSSKGEAKGSRQ